MDDWYTVTSYHRHLLPWSLPNQMLISQGYHSREKWEKCREFEKCIFQVWKDSEFCVGVEHVLGLGKKGSRCDLLLV